jgi:hypothetical protein
LTWRTLFCRRRDNKKVDFEGKIRGIVDWFILFSVGRVVGSCEHGESLGSTKYGEFSEQLWYCKLLKKNSASWSKWISQRVIYLFFLLIGALVGKSVSFSPLVGWLVAWLFGCLVSQSVSQSVSCYRQQTVRRYWCAKYSTSEAKILEKQMV